MKNTTKTDMLEIIFADRNKAYGAYHIRREYPEYLMRAFFAGLALIAILGVIPRLIPGLVQQEKLVIYDGGPVFTEVKIKEAPPKPKMKIAAPPPVVQPAIRFVPPKIVPNEAVPDGKELIDNEKALDDPRLVGVATIAGTPEPQPTDFPDPKVFGGNFNGVSMEEEDTIMSPVNIQKMPSFPGGDAEMMRFIRDNLQYSSIARESNIQGTVALSFVVGKDGGITAVKVLKDIGGLCGKEATRVVNMMPKWTPGEANGHPVKVRFTLPIRFRLQ